MIVGEGSGMPRFPLPVIAQSAAELLEMRGAERDRRRRERLQLLWLVASGGVKSRLEAARHLGRNRETVSRWLEEYQKEGLAGLLRAPLPPGPAAHGGIGLAPEVQSAIRARLAAPAGERGYLALWHWAQAEYALTYSYVHFSRWVREHLGARLKVARPSHAKKKRINSPPSTRRV